MPANFKENVSPLDIAETQINLIDQPLQRPGCFESIDPVFCRPAGFRRL